MTHPYFTDKARSVMERAGGDPENAGPLAQWAEHARRADDATTGVLVAKDGALLAHLVRRFDGWNHHYHVDEIYIDAPRGVLNHGAGDAGADLARVYGQPVIEVRYWEVCMGQGSKPQRDVAAEERSKAP